MTRANGSTLDFVAGHPNWVVAFGFFIVGLVVFASGLNAWFTSDGWKFLEVAHDLGLTDVWVQFVPHPENWYRPLTRLVFHTGYALFGLEPFGYHLTALTFHVATSFLIYLFSYQLVRARGAAILAGLTFLVTLHAHEVVWDVGDLHNALGGVTIMFTVVAYARQRYWLAGLGLALNLLSDETGILTFGLLVWYDALFNMQTLDARKIRAAVMRLAPFAGMLGIYVIARLTIGRGTFLNEQTPCHAPLCLVNGMGEYLNRFFVRPDFLLRFVWSYRPLIAAGLLIILVGAGLVLRVWQWDERRALVFAVGWMIAASFFFVWALWPYVADRFWYVPDMGLALFVGAIAAHAARAYSTNRRSRIVVSAAALGFLLWLAVGVGMLVERGRLWTQSGEEARMIVTRVSNLVPNPPPNPTFVFDGLPDSYYTTFAPGNTGPYLFRNGIREALRLRYGRADVRVERGWESAGAAAAANPLFFRVTPGQVELVVPSIAP